MKSNHYGPRETLSTRDIQDLFHCNATRARAIGYKYGQPYHQELNPSTGRVINRFTAAGILSYARGIAPYAQEKPPAGFCTKQAAASYLACAPGTLDTIVRKGHVKYTYARLAPLNRLQRVYNVADIKAYVNQRHSFTYFKNRNIDPHTGRTLA